MYIDAALSPCGAHGAAPRGRQACGCAKKAFTVNEGAGKACDSHGEERSSAGRSHLDALYALAPAYLGIIRIKASWGARSLQANPRLPIWEVERVPSPQLPGRPAGQPSVYPINFALMTLGRMQWTASQRRSTPAGHRRGCGGEYHHALAGRQAGLPARHLMMGPDRPQRLSHGSQRAICSCRTSIIPKAEIVDAGTALPAQRARAAADIRL